MQPHKINLENKRLKALKWLKIGVWAYILLLIFEGALRKWFLPFLSTPFLIVRDPIAFCLCYTSWKYRFLPCSPFLAGMVIVGFLGIITALVFAHGTLAVAIYGARILLLHFPVVFVMMAVF